MSPRRSPTGAVQRAVAALAEGRLVVVVSENTDAHGTAFTVSVHLVYPAVMRAAASGWRTRSAPGIVTAARPRARSDDARLSPLDRGKSRAPPRSHAAPHKSAVRGHLLARRGCLPRRGAPNVTWV
jgi:3,4-dihydroxy-2-butanone 4-phosphate synthase